MSGSNPMDGSVKTKSKASRKAGTPHIAERSPDRGSHDCAEQASKCSDESHENLVQPQVGYHVDDSKSADGSQIDKNCNNLSVRKRKPSRSRSCNCSCNERKRARLSVEDELSDSVQLFDPDEEDALSEGAFSPDYLESFSDAPLPPSTPSLLPPNATPNFPSLPTPPSSTSSHSNDLNQPIPNTEVGPAPPMLSLEANLVLLTTVKKLAVATGQMQESLNKSVKSTKTTLEDMLAPMSQMEKRMEHQERVMGRLCRQVGSLVDSVQSLMSSQGQRDKTELSARGKNRNSNNMRPRGYRR